jgi:hypothetical protein
MGADGSVIRPLDETSVLAAIERMRRYEVEAVAVCLLHSYRNPAHERRIGEILRSEFPEAFLSLSVDVLPEFREYERTSTAVINAYVGPTVRTYLDSLARQLADAAIGAPVLLMQSNGGAMSAGAAREIPAHILESGPAAGVIAARRLSERTGIRDLITFDMGGTTAKAAMIQDGQVMVAKPPFWKPVFHCGVNAPSEADSLAWIALMVVSQAALTSGFLSVITLPESSYWPCGACAATCRGPTRATRASPRWWRSAWPHRATPTRVGSAIPDPR